MCGAGRGRAESFREATKGFLGRNCYEGASLECTCWGLGGGAEEKALGRGSSRCKDPKAGECLVCTCDGKKAPWLQHRDVGREW